MSFVESVYKVHKQVVLLGIYRERKSKENGKTQRETKQRKIQLKNTSLRNGKVKTFSKVKCRSHNNFKITCFYNTSGWQATLEPHTIGAYV